MKVTGIDSYDLRIPTVKPVALEFAEHRVVAAVIHTDEGIDGLGYTLAFGGGGAESIQVYLETRLKPLIVGEDPLFVERLWERMFRADRGIKRQGVAAYAISAIDVGLWDVVGKVAGMPLFKLWGAVTDRILLIEDDARLAEMVKNYLGGSGFSITIAPTGRAGLGLYGRQEFDALILDLMLPDMDGLEVCRKIRAGAQTPILMLTARGDAMDRVVGLEIGADDYLPKPFEPRELLARLRAILRRSKGGEQNFELMRFGRLEIDVGARQVRRDSEACTMTGYQFDLLLVLARHAGRVMSREAMMDLMKNERLDAFDRSIDVHISRIRAAIEDDPKKPRRVITVRGAGYVFAKAQD